MTLRFAFVGFRHGHIFSAVSAVNEHPDAQLVAACEEDEQTRRQLADDDRVSITHESFEQMLEDVDCDVIGVGDYYGKRGSLIIRALEAGRHVLTDKPMCTSLEEQEKIETLARQKGLHVGCQLTLRGSGQYIRMKELIAEGRIGEVQTVTVTGQHPLNIGSRPQWYFEPGCHGGTINDIGIHGTDMIEWATQRRVASVTAAATWNAKAQEYPHFNDCAQFMLRLDNGGSCLGDMSYLAPKTAGALPNYWRISCHGLKGMVETSLHADHVLLACDEEDEARRVPAAEGIPHRYLNDLLAGIRGGDADIDLTTEQVLRTSRVVLTTQHVADAGPSAFGMEIG